MNKVGRRTKDWQKAWRRIKPQLEAANRTSREFDFLEHECSEILDPVHSKKRREMQGNDIYQVSIGCRTIHDYLDGVNVFPPLGRRITHEEMERFVLRAIHGEPGTYRTDLPSLQLADPVCCECNADAPDEVLDLQDQGWGVNHHGALTCSRCIQGLSAPDLTPRA